MAVAAVVAVAVARRHHASRIGRQISVRIMGAGSVPVEVQSPLALQLLLEVDLNVGVDAEGVVARRHHTSHGGWQTTDRALRAVATTLTIAS